MRVCEKEDGSKGEGQQYSKWGLQFWLIDILRSPIINMPKNENPIVNLKTAIFWVYTFTKYFNRLLCTHVNHWPLLKKWKIISIKKFSFSSPGVEIPLTEESAKISRECKKAVKKSSFLSEYIATGPEGIIYLWTHF